MIAPKTYPEQAPSPEKLVEDHMGLVKRLSWHFSGRIGKFAEIDDLLQAGYLGLVDASRRYSVQDGVSFAAYAAIRIRGSIIDLLRRNSNLCRKSIAMRQSIGRARTALEHRLGRAPEIEELAAELDMEIGELQDWDARLQVNRVQSLDEVYTDHSLLFSHDSATPEQDLERTQLKALLRQAVAMLPEREALVLQLYYVEELNVYEIAAILGVTTGRVSQIKKAAILRLRDIMAEKIA